jgi:molybdate transport system substrate-binding protein
VVAGRTDLARTGIGIAVRKGAPKPDVSSPEALKRAVLEGHAARPPAAASPRRISKACSSGSASPARGTPKVKLAAGGPNGRVSVLVSSGEVEIGLQQVSELMSNPEVEVIGMLPAQLQQMTTYSAGATTGASDAEAAKALIKALTAPGLDPAW